MTGGAAVPLPDGLEGWGAGPFDCWRAQGGTYGGGVYDSEFIVGRDFCEIAREFLGVDLDAMEERKGGPCWASLERFRTFHTDGRPCLGDDWDEERDTELVGFRASDSL